MRYFTPLLPPGEIFQSKANSKSEYLFLLNKSSVNVGFARGFKQPSSIVQASPFIGLPGESAQPFMDLPSNRSFHPPDFSSGVSWFSAATKVNIDERASTSFIRRFGTSASRRSCDCVWR